jgi:hypothetical protein
MVSAFQIEPHYRIAEIARMLHISRASVYNLIRGKKIIDLSGRRGKGVKLIPASTLREILEERTRTFR